MGTISITITKDSTPESFLADAAQGKIHFHTERGDGSYRRIHYLPEGSKERKNAEWIIAQRDTGKTMRQISNEMHTSIATVRRTINDMLFTQELEETSLEDLAEWITGAEESGE